MLGRTGIAMLKSRNGSLNSVSVNIQTGSAGRVSGSILIGSGYVSEAGITGSIILRTAAANSNEDTGDLIISSG